MCIVPCSHPADNQCHTSSIIFSALRGYLTHEWQRKATEQETRAQFHHMANKGTPYFDFYNNKAVGSLAVTSVPQQDNHCDCGLYVLAFVEFFAYANPAAVTMKALNALIARHDQEQKKGKGERLQRMRHAAQMYAEK